jgi:hypothetical protein
VNGLAPGDWQAISSIGTLVVAVVAAAIALTQVQQARRLRIEQARPYVAAYLERADAHTMDLVIKNFGLTTARDVRLKSDRPLRMRWDQDSETLELFESLPVLVPGQEWRTMWDINGHRIEDDELPYELTVMTNDSRGKRLPDEKFTLDTRPHLGSFIKDEKGLHEIAESLLKIERSVSRWGATGDGLLVFARDGDAHEERRRLRRDEAIKRRSSEQN